MKLRLALNSVNLDLNFLNSYKGKVAFFMVLSTNSSKFGQLNNFIIKIVSFVLTRALLDVNCLFAIKECHKKIYLNSKKNKTKVRFSQLDYYHYYYWLQDC